MKNNKIRILFIFLFFPHLGNCFEGELLYKWETSSGIEWKGFGDIESQSLFKGDVDNGKPNGLGILTTPKGEKYVGEWKDGEFDGNGVFTFIDGSIYEGSWKNNEENGNGKREYNDGGTTIDFDNGEKYIKE